MGFLPPHIFTSFSIGRFTKLKQIGEFNMEKNLRYYAAHWNNLDFQLRKMLACAVLGKIGEKYNG